MLTPIDSTGPRPRLSAGRSVSAQRPARLLLTGLLALVAVLALAGFALQRYVLANANPAVNYASSLNQQLLAGAPPGDNAWPIYRDIIRNRLGLRGGGQWRSTALYDLLHEEPPRLRRDHIELLRMGDWSDPRLDPSKQALDQLRVLLPALDEAAEKPRFVKFYYPGSDALAQQGLPPSGKPAARMIDILLPELGSMRALARLNAAAMREAAANDNWSEVVRRLRTGLAMGAQLAQQDTLIEGLVAISMQALALEELQLLLNERDVPADALAPMLDAVNEHDIPVSRALDWLEGERLMELDAVQWVYSANGALLTWQLDNLSSSPPAPPTIGERLANVVAIAMPSKGRVERDINRFFEAARDYAAAPLSAKDAKGQVVDQRASANRVLEMLAPAITRPLLQIDRLAAERTAAGLVLRLEAFHARTGEWPESLEAADLGDAILEPATGQPFIYRRLKDDPQSRPYLLDFPVEFHSHLPSNARLSEINPPREDLPEARPSP